MSAAGGRRGVKTGGRFERSPFEVGIFEGSLDRVNALLRCSIGGRPAFEASDLDGEAIDPGVSRTDRTSWTFLIETAGMMSLVVGIPVKRGEWIEPHVLCKSEPGLDARGFAIHGKSSRRTTD